MTFSDISKDDCCDLIARNTETGRHVSENGLWLIEFSGPDGTFTVVDSAAMTCVIVRQ